MFKIKEVEDNLNEAIRNQEYQLKSKELVGVNENIDDYTDLIFYNLEASKAVLTDDNDIDIFKYVNELIIKLAECLTDNKGKIEQKEGK